MNELAIGFTNNLMDHNKEKCIEMVLDALAKGEVSVIDLYNQVLTPALNNIPCHNREDEYCIWAEHVKTSIVRTVIECCYPYVLKERDTNGKLKKDRVVVICPDGENHDLGAKMVADFFTIEGYDTTFVGASTPRSEFINLIKVIKPQILALSVTNYYNLVSAKATIQEIKSKAKHPLDIVVGGNAFKNNSSPDIDAEVTILKNYEDLKRFIKEGPKYDSTP